MLPPSPREFRDIFVVFELMETDLHQVPPTFSPPCPHASLPVSLSPHLSFARLRGCAKQWYKAIVHAWCRSSRPMTTSLRSTISSSCTRCCVASNTFTPVLVLPPYLFTEDTISDVSLCMSAFGRCFASADNAREWVLKVKEEGMCAAKVFHRDLKPKNILANSDCKLKVIWRMLTAARSACLVLHLDPKLQWVVRHRVAPPM